MNELKGFRYEQLIANFTVDFETGVVRNLRGIEVGWVVKKKHTSYRITRYKGVDLPIHQLVYFLYHKSLLTSLCIDHVDGNGLNNKIDNLRQVDKSLNALNKKETQSKINKYRGVYWSESRQKYFVQIQVGGVKHTLGRFENIEYARQTYIDFKDNAISNMLSFAALGNLDK